VADSAEWERTRARLRFGQRLCGTVVRVPRPGAIGIAVDVGLPVEGFVDAALLPGDAERWPAEGTEAEFEVWWAGERPRLRLKPVDPRFLRDDFDRYLQRFRPGWPEEIGRPVPLR